MQNVLHIFVAKPVQSQGHKCKVEKWTKSVNYKYENKFTFLAVSVRVKFLKINGRVCLWICKLINRNIVLEQNNVY